MEFGTRVADKVTGFKGVVIARAEYQFEGPQVLVAAETRQEASDSRWIAESRVEPDATGEPQPPGFRS